MARQQARGRSADRPREIPKAGWRDIFWRVKDEMTRDNLSIVAAGLAFYGLLSLFPLITAIVSIYGLVVDPQDVQRQVAELSRLTARANAALGFGVIFGLILTL